MNNPSPFSNQPAMSSSPLSPSLPIQHDKNAPAVYRFTSYLIRRKVLKLIGAAFFVDDPSGNVVMYANQKGFKLKEDIRLYTGEDMQTELLRISARSWFDMNSVYDVIDATNETKVGALKRKGWKSMMQDEWEILDAQDRVMGTIKEESLALALIRRYIEITALFLPQKYDIQVGGRDMGGYQQNKNPLLIKLACDFSGDQNGVFDRRLGIAAGVLLCAIEGKQS